MDKPKSTQEIQQTDVNKALYYAALQTIRINTIRQWEKTVHKPGEAIAQSVFVKMPYDDDRIYVVTHVAAMNHDKDITTIELYNVKAGERHVLNADAPSAARVSINWDGELISGTNQSIEAVFRTPTTDDDCMVTVSGYWVPK